jgi:hypothetical protein
MGLIFSLLISSAVAGAIYVYLVPMLMAQVPASLTANKYVSVAVTGGFILLTMWATLIALRAGRKVV